MNRSLRLGLVVVLGVFVGVPFSATAAILAGWDFEGGDLSPSVQGNFIAARIEVFNGGTVSYAPNSGIGGGGAIAYEEDPNPGAGPSNIVFFTIENTHPTESIEMEFASLSFAGEPGEVYTTWFRLNASGLGDIDDSVPAEGAWTSRTYDVSGPLGFSDLEPGESYSIGWSLASPGASNLSTHFLDDISITGTEPVPEPSVTLLLAIGIGSVLGKRRRRQL